MRSCVCYLDPGDIKDRQTTPRHPTEPPGLWERAMARRANWRSSTNEAKEENRWRDGINLGILDNTNEFILGTSEGIVKTPYEVRRRPLEEQWNAQEIKLLRGDPGVRQSIHATHTLGVDVTFEVFVPDDFCLPEYAVCMLVSLFNCYVRNIPGLTN